jgi:FkbM family methyltransferase
MALIIMLACLAGLVITAACECQFYAGNDIVVKSLHQHMEEHPRNSSVTLTADKFPCKGMLTNLTMYGRPHTSDGHVLQAIFIHHEFSFLDTLFHEAPKTILDLGANIGASAAYFATRYPDATVVALEPHFRNFMLATINTQHLQNVIMLHAAAWDTNTLVKIDIAKSLPGEWGYVVAEVHEADVSTVLAKRATTFPGYSVHSIMQRHGWSRIDFLKIDIECGEYTVLNEKSLKQGWLHLVGCVTLEVHACGTDRSQQIENINKIMESHGLHAMEGYFGELNAWCKLPK